MIINDHQWWFPNFQTKHMSFKGPIPDIFICHVHCPVAGALWSPRRWAALPCKSVTDLDDFCEKHGHFWISALNQPWLAGKSHWMEVSSARKITDQWSIFHCHVWLPEGIIGEQYEMMFGTSMEPMGKWWWANGSFRDLKWEVEFQRNPTDPDDTPD